MDHAPARVIFIIRIPQMLLRKDIDAPIGA